MNARTSEVCVALLADLVGSRAASDRAALHRRVTDALGRANARFAPLDALHVTVGDEFQGLFATLGEALGASYLLRLTLGADDDVRFGLGRGRVQVIDADHNVQDGSAWWAARAAIEQVELRARGAHRVLRTGLAAAPDAEAPGPALVAAVEATDALLAGLDASGRVILSALLAGRTQAEAADDLGVSRSAVSQRVARGGIAVLADTITRLQEVR